MSLQRRVDKSDPRDSAAIQPFAPPPEWTEKRLSGYITILSTISMSLGMTMMTPYPDLVTFSILLGLIQVANVKPFERDSQNEPTSNAAASLFFSVLMTLSNSFSKLVVKKVPGA
ncbi:hypothetical protein MCUN1_001378 [Malassezia cuniculi]|uniref:Uncharacterized protein n=1 Tax=Malassezia cuniculi TaxID=948313 RepID=A0AAF0EXI6_9BASI|nr:hypothetical protein MCUN1_001378 [Malassezia cuniculi]